MIFEMMDKESIREMQDGFAGLADVLIYCVDGESKELTSMSGHAPDAEKMMQLIGKQQLIRLYDRICASSIEDQIVEDTEYSNVKIAAVSVKAESKPIICWLACCVLDIETLNKNGKFATGFSKVTTEEKFYQALDLMRMWMSGLVESAAKRQEAEARSRRSHYSETEMGQALKRTETMTNIVQLLVGNEPFEELANRTLEAACEYLGAEAAQLIRISKDGQYVDAIAGIGQWDGLMVGGEPVERPPVAQNEKSLIVSSGTTVPAGLREYMSKKRLSAFMSIPVLIRGNVAMYLFFAQTAGDRVWKTEEVKFAADVAKILQSMLERRIARNSMASSYQSLTEILNMVGSCVYVRDIETEEVLFVNDLLKFNFEQELKQGTLNALLDEARPLGVREGFYELHHMARKRWYDMHYKYIDWVDGRKVAFCALYDITDKKLYQRKIEQQAYTDFLTGLYNRMCCERDLAMQIENAKLQKRPGGLLYLDLDDFKHINDGLGHQYGDVLLKSISNSLQRIEGIRNSCYRMGGDEFVIIVPPESFERFDAITEEIKAIFAKPWFLKDADYYCTMSMGICHFPENGEDVQDLIKKADIAMYEAKKTGKNRVARYSDSISSTSGKRLDMEKNMRNASSDGYKEFEVYYQPIIDIQKPGTPCTGAEALVRWNSAAFGFIPPSDFIPLAEYLGLINPIGNHVMYQACKACKYWNDNGHPEYKVNVNLSVVQLLQTDIVDIVKRTLDETGVNPRNLTLEVTESLAINDMERMKEILNSIRELGARIALDDFGTGYSSLNHIREIPLDVIKVDQSFVSELAEDSYSQSFIKMVAELAGAIGVSICIEGIETREQYKVLEGMQVRLVQGYYFDRPMPRDRFEEKYLK